jgi:hypothetical protein
MYTKQSIRATGATILGRNCAQIMTVTGHKSFSSVAVYQRVSSKMMGDIITGYTVNNVTTASHATTKYPQLQLMPPTQKQFNITCSIESHTHISSSVRTSLTFLYL